MFNIEKVPPSSLKAHRILLLITFFYIYLNIAFPELRYGAIIFSAGLFICYTWRRILTIIICAAIAFILVRLHPALAPVAFILMAVIFLVRIGYIIRNWPAVLSGFYMYALALGFAFYGSIIKSLLWMYFGWTGFLFYHLFPYPYNVTIQTSFFAALVAFIGTWSFHKVILWLYRHHYGLQQALPIMGAAPLIIGLLFLPLLKAVDVIDGSFYGDSMDGTDTPGDTVHGEAFHSSDTADSFHAADTAHSGDGIHSPGTHYTHGYLRTGANGDVHYVRGYEATNPDGITENNYSAHGISSVRGEPIPYEPAPPPQHIDGNLSRNIPFIGAAKEELKKQSNKHNEAPPEKK